MKSACAGLVLFSLLASSISSTGQTSSPAQADVQQGQDAFQHGDFAGAEQHFSAALRSGPNLPDAAQVEANLGLAYYADHQFAKAVAAFEQALKRDPSIEIAKGFLPVSQAAAGDCARATPGLDREFESNPDVKLRRILGLSLERCAAEAGDEMKADAVTQKLLAAYPDDPDVLYTAGQLYGRLSSEVNLKLMKVAPGSPRTYQLMASVAAADGNWKGAIDAYRKALHLQPGLQGAHLQIAVLTLMHSTDPNAWHQAITELNEELKVDPTSAEAEYEIGEAYRKHDQLESAVAAFRKALALDSEAVPARLGLAKALRQLGRRSEALTALEPASRSAPNDPDVHFVLAQIYRDLGQTAEAQKEMAAFQRLRATAPAPQRP
ncbi:MAG TPA: tetratricopeptide repeat protein [Terriglobia bacterium]|nr:tetratricopeptide repeat protein [Terriglobia bacterium]